MKNLNKFLIKVGILLLLISVPISSQSINEDKLKVESGKMLFTLIKTMAGSESTMSGIANDLSGEVDMKAKTFDFNMKINLTAFALGGSFKFANDRMHETYLESSKYSSANFKGTIISYDPSNGNAKVKGKMTIHGVTKNNVEMDGVVTKSDSGQGYLLTSSFKVNLNDYKIKVPDIKLAKVSETVSLKIKLELRSMK